MSDHSYGSIDEPLVYNCPLDSPCYGRYFVRPSVRPCMDKSKETVVGPAIDAGQVTLTSFLKITAAIRE